MYFKESWRNTTSRSTTITFNSIPLKMSTPLVALVTAGSAGLGAAIARRFARSGMRVAVNYSSNASRASALLEELQELSPLPQKGEDTTNFISIQADLSLKSDILLLVEETVKQMGRLDVVFSNGGWTSMQDFDNLDDNVDEEMWDKCWNMNVKSHLWLMHAARKYLDETEGCFISTASLAGVRPSGSSLVRIFHLSTFSPPTLICFLNLHSFDFF